MDEREAILAFVTDYARRLRGFRHHPEPEAAAYAAQIVDSLAASIEQGLHMEDASD